MTTGNRTSGLTDATIRVAPLMVAMVLATSFLAGILVMVLWTTTHAAEQSSTVQPYVAFDAVKFRADERSAIQPSATFDAVKFRADERSAVQPSATFDAVKFRAEERSLQP